jgi:hypothetical protein
LIEKRTVLLTLGSPLGQEICWEECALVGTHFLPGSFEAEYQAEVSQYIPQVILLLISWEGLFSLSFRDRIFFSALFTTGLLSKINNYKNFLAP